MTFVTFCHRAKRCGAAALVALLASGMTLAQNIPFGSPIDPTLSNQSQQQDDGLGRQSRDESTQPRTSTVTPTQPSFEPAQISGSSTQPRMTQDSLSDERLDFERSQIRRPATPGEFERYVSDATGRRVKRFGTDLLIPGERDFAVAATATIPPDYAINVGDVVSINLIGSVEGSVDFPVDRNGRIFVPKVGEVSVIGVRYRDLRDHIAAAIGRQYRGYEVSVSIKELRGLRVYVTGFANNPGAYTVNSLSTLVNAVLAAGGPNAGGSFRTVKLYRNGKEIRDFDLYELIRRGNKSTDAVLQNEDVLFIPPVGPQVAVIGSVNEEAIYEALPGETMEQMLAAAGGPNQLADPSRVILYRLSDKDSVGSREIARASLPATTIQGGDVVQVLTQGALVRSLERQSVVVRIEGEVNKPGNYFVAPNTPLSTVLEMAGGLTPRAFVYGTKFSRVSVRAQQRESYREAINQLEMTLAASALTPGELPSQTENRNEQIQAARAVLDRLKQAEPDGRLVMDIPYANPVLPGTLLLENNDRIIIPPRVDTIGVFGSVYRPASFLLGNQKPPKVRDYLERAGGTQRAADRGNIFVVRANGEVLTRKRGALNARVQPGDVIFVPVKTQSSSLLAKIRDISQIIFQFGLSAAAVAAIK